MLHFFAASQFALPQIQGRSQLPQPDLRDFNEQYRL